MKLRRLFWLLPIPFGTAAADVSLFEGRPGNAGNVLVLDENGIEQRPSELQGIVLLPVDCVGRTHLTELLAGEPRLRLDVPFAARILLPFDGGSLYRYRRDAPLGGTPTFGVFVVGADGAARNVFAVAGTGPSGSNDPIPGKIAVGPTGRSILVATTLTAGGDLWEIDLITGSAVNRTSELDPQSFQRDGLALFTSWGIGLTVAGPLRFDRSTSGQASSVPLPAPVAWFGADVVASADESTAAVVGGAGPSAAQVFTFGATGGALAATSSPMSISGAGFLPESQTGPTLALSPDGSQVAWRSEGFYSECWLRQTNAAPSIADVQVTGDANFDDTLNETGVIAFFSPSSVVLIVGRTDGVGIGQADLFRADVQANGSLAITNLSGTSGEVRTPFDYGRLNTADGIFQLSASAWLVHDAAHDDDDDRDDESNGKLLWIDAGTGAATPLLDHVQSLDLLETAGSYWVASVHRSNGGLPLNLLQIPPGGLGTTVSAIPACCHLSRPASLAASNEFAAVLELSDGERLGRFQAPSVSGIALGSTPLTFGPTLGFDRDGTLLGTAARPGDWIVFAWSRAGVSLVRPLSEGFLLPGL